jgi:hypothetical protein
MSERLSASVGIASHDGVHWRIMLTYSDGDVFLSAMTYTDKAEAEAAARTWALENCVIPTKQ